MKKYFIGKCGIDDPGAPMQFHTKWPSDWRWRARDTAWTLSKNNREVFFLLFGPNTMETYKAGEVVSRYQEQNGNWIKSTTVTTIEYSDFTPGMFVTFDSLHGRTTRKITRVDHETSTLTLAGPSWWTRLKTWLTTRWKRWTR